MATTSESPFRAGRKTAPQVVRYERPDPARVRRKGVMPLSGSDILRAHVQFVTADGANSLHAHTATDGLYFVLAGRARFYGKDDEVIADIGRHEGVFIPRGVAYWFESAAEEPLEILLAFAIDKSVEDRRIDFAPQTRATRGALPGAAD